MRIFFIICYLFIATPTTGQEQASNDAPTYKQCFTAMEALLQKDRPLASKPTKTIKSTPVPTKGRLRGIKLLSKDKKQELVLAPRPSTSTPLKKAHLCKTLYGIQL